MKTQKLIRGHTVAQRRRLFALARLLNKVSPRKFSMHHWVSRKGGWADPCAHLASDCGFAGCAMGWGLAVPEIRQGAEGPLTLLAGLGFDPIKFCDPGDKGTALFGPSRRVSAKQVAADIRAYLKDGTLPA